MLKTFVISGKVVDLPAPKPFQSASTEVTESRMLMEAAAGHPGYPGLEPQGYLVPDTGHWVPSPQYGHQSPADHQAYFQFPPATANNCYGDNLVKVS